MNARRRIYLHTHVCSHRHTNIRIESLVRTYTRATNGCALDCQVSKQTNCACTARSVCHAEIHARAWAAHEFIRATKKYPLPAHDRTYVRSSSSCLRVYQSLRERLLHAHLQPPVMILARLGTTVRSLAIFSWRKYICRDKGIYGS